MGKFTIADPADKKKSLEVKFRETSSGKNRGVTVTVEGVTGKGDYAIDPNPHNATPKYNKQQAKFYIAMATAVAEDALANGAFSSKVSARWEKVDFTLS